LVRRLFGYWAIPRIKASEPDLVIGWSSWAESPLRMARAYGIRFALERGSTHIGFQSDILRDEFARWGMKGEAVSPDIVARELAEYEQADWITVPSSFARDSFRQHQCRQADVEVIPLGVDVERFRPAREPSEKFVVLFVGLIDLRKGVPYLLQAYDVVRDPGTELVLIGSLSGDMRRVLGALGVPYRHVRSLAAGGVASYMARAGAFVIPSLEEGLARVILEAMASGVPVIATPNSGAGDVISDDVDGFIVPVRDVGAIADRLRALRRNRERAREMGAHARAKVEQHFTQEQYGLRVASLLARRMPQELTRG